MPELPVVIVAGHAICTDPKQPFDDSNWVLLDFQRGEAACYVEHIRAGVELAAADPDSLLIFAGGQSRREAGPRSEAQSYYWIADSAGWFGHAEVQHRAITEEFSRDSFENLLFGICRAREYSGRYPDYVTFVSWAFKQRRFELHRNAIGWPAERFRFAGPNNPPRLEQAIAAESQTEAGYLADPYSVTPAFRAKRDARNPFRRHHGYAASCPELTPLFSYEASEPYPGSLPWRKKFP